MPADYIIYIYNKKNCNEEIKILHSYFHRNKNKENCMTDRPMDIDPNFHEVIKEMPGQLLGPNEQCKEKLGSGSFYGWVGISCLKH